MNEKIKYRLRRRESIIVLAFTIFSLFLGYVSVSSGWSDIMIPVLLGEVFLAWWWFIRDFRTYEDRALFVTVFASGSVFFYGYYGLNFPVLIPTLCVFTVLFSLYQVSQAMAMVHICNFSLFLYHLLFARTFSQFFPTDDTMVIKRLALQMLSFVTLCIIVSYSVHRSQEEERDVREMAEMVQMTQKIKNDFVANTSHELRTPIHTISGMSEILLQEDLPENIHREVLDIQMTGIELQTIVSDILDYASLEAGTLALEPRAYNITSTLNDVMNMTVFQNREKKLELIFDCDPRIPCSLYGDERQLRRVINNLIGNAIKFTNVGGIVVNVTCRKEAYGVNLIVRVKDTGKGLTEEEQERIFQGFYQTDAERNRGVEGMGLGLTISSSIVKKMGGFMNVRSEAGKGSVFAFSIPQKVMDERPCISVAQPALINVIWYFNELNSAERIRDDYVSHIRNLREYLGLNMVRAGSLLELKRRIRQAQFTHLMIREEEYAEDPAFFDDISLQMPVIMIADRDSMRIVGGRVRILYKPYSAMTLAEFFNGRDSLPKTARLHEVRQFVAPDAKILVVDDNIMNLKVVEGLLRKYRIKITAASSGEEALTLIESKDYDFVFMDHMMPGMDGIECFHHIRAKHGSAYYSKVPVIALTANAISGAREMFLEEGFDDFLAKPIDNALLDDMLRRYISVEKQFFADEDGVPEPEAPAKPAETALFAEEDGIDMKTALAYCGGSLDDYIDLANVYYSTGERYSQQLEESYENKDWKTYATIAHTIKSTSKTIGAMRLSDIAFKEETAAKTADEVMVTQYHEQFMKEYHRILTLLHGNPRIIKHTEKETPDHLTELDAAEWKEIRKELQQCLETYEAEAVYEVAGRYEQYALGGVPLTELLRPVTESVDRFDFDAATQALYRIGGDAE